MSGVPAILIIYALLTLGAVVAAVLTVSALRRIARSHERAISLLEELVHAKRRDRADTSTQEADTGGSSTP